MGDGVTITGSASTIVTSGLTLYLDGGNYPGSGSTWADQSGNSNNGTLVNSPTYSSNNGGYFTFVPASVQYVTTLGAPLNTTNYTKSIWFYLNATTDNNLISYDNGVNTGHFMFFGGTNRLYAGHTSWTGFPYTYQSTGSFSNSTWYNVVLTFNTTDGMKMYINGSLDSTYTAQKTAPASGGIRLACYSAGGNLFSGRIAQSLVYNRSLTLSEIAQNFNVTRSRFGI